VERSSAAMLAASQRVAVILRAAGLAQPGEISGPAFMLEVELSEPQLAKVRGLIRKADAAQRLTNRVPDVGASSMGPDEARDGKAGLQLRHPPCQGLGFVEPAQH
jgi:hypothetical protein